MYRFVFAIGRVYKQTGLSLNFLPSAPSSHHVNPSLILVRLHPGNVSHRIVVQMQGRRTDTNCSRRCLVWPMQCTNAGESTVGHSAFSLAQSGEPDSEQAGLVAPKLEKRLSPGNGYQYIATPVQAVRQADTIEGTSSRRTAVRPARGGFHSSHLGSPERAFIDPSLNPDIRRASSLYGGRQQSASPQNVQEPASKGSTSHNNSH